MMESEDKIVISNFRQYLEIAREANNLAQSSAVLRHETMIKDGSNHQKIIKAATSVHKNATISVVFSVMAIEAFINEYTINNFSKKFLKNHLDSLNLISKLLLIPKLARKKELDTDGRLFEDTKWLIDLRNSLVHHRTKSISIKEIDYSDLVSQRDFMLEQHSEKSFNTMLSLINYLSTEFEIT